MEKVTLSKAARKVFGERLGRPVPDPNSKEFDELLEELREMQPEAYNDLYSALSTRANPYRSREKPSAPINVPSGKGSLTTSRIGKPTTANKLRTSARQSL